MSNAVSLPLNAGSDFSAILRVKNQSDGSIIPLTGGATVEIFESSGAVGDWVSAAITDATAGQITVTAAWQSSFPRYPSLLSFRVRVTLEGVKTSFPSMNIVIT